MNNLLSNLIPLILALIQNNYGPDSQYLNYNLDWYKNGYPGNPYDYGQILNQTKIPFFGNFVRKVTCNGVYNTNYFHAYQASCGRIVLTGGTESNGYSPIINITGTNSLSASASISISTYVPSHYSYSKGIELPNGLFAFGSTNNYYIYGMNPRTGAVNTTYTGSNHYSWILQMVINRYLCSGGTSAYIYCWDTYTNQQSVAPLNSWYAHGSQCWAMTTYNGLLVSGGIDQQVKIWKIELVELVRTLDSMPHYVMSLAMTRENNIVGISYNSYIYVWNSCSGVVINSWTVPDSVYDRVLVHPNGNIIMCPYYDTQAVVYDNTGKRLCAIRGHYPCMILNDGSFAIYRDDHFNIYN